MTEGVDEGPIGPRSGPSGRELVLALVGVLLVASALRALLTPVGPLLGVLERQTGASTVVLGLLTALPVLAFAVVSPLVHGLSTRFGVERSVFLGLVLVVVGSGLRSVTSSPWALLGGTAVLGGGIAVGNVLIPVVVKHFFPRRVPEVTGGYMAVQTIGAALAAGLVVPLHDRTGSWQIALGIWVLPAVLALVTWLPRLRTPVVGTPTDARQVNEHGAGHAVDPSPWRSMVGWQVAGYFLVQSAGFYTIINWLPTVSVDLGFTEAEAGSQMFWFMMISLIGNFAAPRLIRVGGDQRFVAVLLPAMIPLPLLGLVHLPQADMLWIAILGIAFGGSMVLSLTLINLRSTGIVGAGRLSSMAQSVAYTGAVCVLVAASLVRDARGAGPDLLWLLGGLAAAQIVVGFLVGRDRRLLSEAS
ncbi:MAG: MFS transporter [Actinomycetaceae bacterium]